MKTLYYYQTFIGLDQLLKHMEDIDIVTISSIHFDVDSHNQPQIYLNDNLPNDIKFNKLWKQTKVLSENNCSIMLMIGGAGGAYTKLFQNFSVYYPLLKKLLHEQIFIKGVNLDIEEEVTLDNIKMLIRNLNKDFGTEFIISMAPISESMIHDGSGMGGFCYKELYNSYEGKMIHYFNVQCYQSFSKQTYSSIINNGYPPDKIIMGMLSGQFIEKTFPKALEEVKKCLLEYPTMKGVYTWEYIDAPPNIDDPSQWAKFMKKISIQN